MHIIFAVYNRDSRSAIRSVYEHLLNLVSPFILREMPIRRKSKSCMLNSSLAKFSCVLHGLPIYKQFGIPENRENVFEGKRENSRCFINIFVI